MPSFKSLRPLKRKKVTARKKGRRPRVHKLATRPIPIRTLGPRFAIQPKADLWLYSFPRPLGYEGQRAIWRDREGNFHEGTLPEYAIFWALEQRGAEFRFQTSLFGGQQRIGGVVADFIITAPLPNLIIRVQGLYWHKDKERERLQKNLLVGEGYYVIDIDSDDALAAPLAKVDDAFALLDTSSSFAS